MEDVMKTESEIRAEVERKVREEVAKEREAELIQKARAARYERKDRAAALVGKKHDAAVAKAKAKAKGILYVVMAEEERSSSPMAYFTSKAEAKKVAKTSGFMGTEGSVEEMLLWESAADYAEYRSAVYAREQAMDDARRNAD